MKKTIFSATITFLVLQGAASGDARGKTEKDHILWRRVKIEWKLSVKRLAMLDY